MKHIVAVFFCTVTLACTLLGQAGIIRGTIEDAGDGKVFLASYFRDRFSIVDSMEISNGAFYFLLGEKDPPGIYRIIYPQVRDGIRSENRFIELIYNREDIEIYVASTDSGPVPHFENSPENDVYLDFAAFELEYEASLMELYNSLISNGPGDPGYDSIAVKYLELQVGRNRFMDSVSHLHPRLYATRIMNAFRSPVVHGYMSHRDRIDTLKMSFFDHAALDDPSLLYAPVYTFRLIEFLSLYKVDTLPQARQEEAFIEAVDRIMVNVSGEPELRSFVVEFMLQGFELLGMEQVRVHLADHYLDESCESDIVELVLSRMEGYTQLAEGMKAPDFVIRDMHGRNYQLSKMDHPYVLVMFWASTCEHCQEMIPELHAWYLDENIIDLEVVAISIDTSAAFFEIFTEMLEPQWITSHETLGWNGKVPGEYFIYATPSLFLLDRDRTILAKPGGYRQFLRAVKKLNP